MLKKNTVLVLAAVAGLAVSGWSAGVSFDQGVDLKAAVAASADKLPDVPEASSKYIGRIYETKDCATFTFTPGSPLKSGAVQLTSTEMIEECYDVPEPVHPQPNHPGGGPGPRSGEKMQNCYTRPGHSWHQYAQVNITGSRELLPWETESFEVCMQGSSVDLYQAMHAYNYSVSQSGGQFDLTPLYKIPTPAVANGVSGSVSYDGKLITFSVTDQLAQYYNGEKIQITAKLIQDHTFWFDDLIAQQDAVVDSAEQYTLISNRTLASGRYFVQWGFKRISAISKDNYVNMGNTSTFDVK